MNYTCKTLMIIIFVNFLNANLLKPFNNQIISYSHIHFEWEQNPDAIQYQLQLSDSQSFNQNLILDVRTDNLVYIFKDDIDWNETYYWRIRDIYENDSYGPWTIPSSFVISEKKFGVVSENLEIDIFDVNQASNELTMLGDLSGGLSLISYVFDESGKEIWNGEIMLSHINEFGQFFGSTYEDFPNNTGIQMNYDGNILWNGPNNEYIDLHEIKTIPNGNYMAFVWEYQNGPIPNGAWTNVYRALGYEADGVTNEFPWFGQAIVEWNENSEEVWRWSPFEHFTMNDYDAYGGTWWDAINGTQYDWMHSNAFHFDDEESAIYFSSRHLSRITKIDYPSGEIIWMIGLPNEFDGSTSDVICSDLGFTWQHNIQMLENGNFLMFDNGNLSQLFGTNRPISRAIEFRVIDNSECEMVWEYVLPENMFGPWMGSVQKLDNNNYFINTVGSGGNVIEVNQNKEIVWEGKYQLTENQSDPAGNYRSYKIPSLHPNAYDVIFKNYKTVENIEGIYIDDVLEISISNLSGYNQYYEYQLIDNNQYFENESDSFIISPYDTYILSFDLRDLSLSSTEINFLIKPTYHDYDSKSYNLNVYSNQILGDLNYDGILNILDIVNLMSLIIDQNEYVYIADLNQDGIVNILDIVSLIAIILD